MHFSLYYTAIILLYFYYTKELLPDFLERSIKQFENFYLFWFNNILGIQVK